MVSGKESTPNRILVHLASGIGNIVLATPLLEILSRNGFKVDILLDADYEGVAELFDGWDVVARVFKGPDERPILGAYGHLLVAIPPFYWSKYSRRYAARNVYRPPDNLFYRDERGYYLDFARQIGCEIHGALSYFLPTPTAAVGRRRTALVLAPGSKPGLMSAKRWPFFGELAALFPDVTLVGTKEDLSTFDGQPMQFPQHVTSYIGRVSLYETAIILANAGVVVANDCGLGHLAGALRVPTILLFGPTPHQTLGSLPHNVTVLRSNLPCEPCWLRSRLEPCNAMLTCLKTLNVPLVASLVTSRMR